MIQERNQFVTDAFSVLVRQHFPFEVWFGVAEDGFNVDSSGGEFSLVGRWFDVGQFFYGAEIK